MCHPDESTSNQLEGHRQNRHLSYKTIIIKKILTLAETVSFQEAY